MPSLTPTPSPTSSSSHRRSGPTASDGTKQVVYYNSGVGSRGTIDRILGGVFGFGLESNVKRALAFVTLNYEVREDAAGREKKVFRDGIEYTDGDGALARHFISWTRGFHDREFGRHMDIGLH